MPGEDDVVTCRYRSSFVDDTCPDFPAAAGWTEAEVASLCAGQAGADPATVVVTRGESCLVEKGGAAGKRRCAVTSDGRPWFAYGTPGFVCTTILGGADQVGPFCEAY